jgi:transposase-like protein
LRGEDSIAELCRREGISQGIYYKWSKDFMEAGKKRLVGKTTHAANADEVKDLRREARDLKEVVAEQALELRLLKKHVRRRGRPRMRYPASEKLEIIRLVEGSHLSPRLTVATLGIPRTTFYRWYDRYLQRGEAGLQDQSPKPKHVWNRIPDAVRRKVVKLALKKTELSPRKPAVTLTDTERYFVSET